MKISELKCTIEELGKAGIEDVIQRLLEGENYTAPNLNEMLFYINMMDEDAICIDYSCDECPFNYVEGTGCIAASSDHVRELIRNKLPKKEDIETML